jgi:outer membrane protein OmpA-like peptidoglycan-associated protein
MSRCLLTAFVLLPFVSLPAQSAAQSAPAGTSATTLAIRYEEGKTTDILVDGTRVSPRTRGTAKVKATKGSAEIELEMKDLPPANTLGASYATYVVWAITPEGQANNLGELPWKGDAKLRGRLAVQRFALIVSAEPYGALTMPSDRIVAENRLKQGESVASTGEITYRHENAGAYDDLPNDVSSGRETPVPVAAARLSVQVAKRAGAETYARGELTQASQKLEQMERGYYAKPKNEGEWGSFARETQRLAQAARVAAGSRRAEVALAEEREAQLKAIEEARNVAEAAAAAARAERERAEAERLAAERAAADQRAAQAEAERARQAALAAQLQAEQQRQAATAALQQANAAREQAADAQRDAAAAQRDADAARAAQQAAFEQASAALKAAEQATAQRDALQQQLQVSLNSILSTSRTARGLIVNLGDVLFDTGFATLRPEAREKLSRLSGVLLAYPAAYTLEFEGHTDSIGSDEFNDKLSVDRAEAVRAYIVGAGVRAERVLAVRGFGKTMPIASNENAEGRQLNRRVEIVINDR